jgi:ferric-dicitrate binding protein FerR (iron transport regulator)
MTDKLLLELGRVARERQQAEAHDERWESLTQGTLSEADRKELERLAQEDPAAGEAYEAFKPLDSAARDRITARLERELSAEAPKEALPPAQVVPLAPRRRLRMAVPGVAALAAAAAVFLLVSPRGGPPLPGYTLSLSSEQEVRSGAPEAEVPRLGPGSLIDLILRPEQAVAEPVEVRAFLLRPGEARAWTPPMERSAEGAVRIHGSVESLLSIPPGEWTLAIAVGRPGTLPTDPGELRPLVEEGRAPAAGSWRLLTRRFLLVDRK